MDAAGAARSRRRAARVSERSRVLCVVELPKSKPRIAVAAVSRLPRIKSHPPQSLGGFFWRMDFSAVCAEKLAQMQFHRHTSAQPGGTRFSSSLQVAKRTASGAGLLECGHNPLNVP
jgi:hypothetical protein